MMKAIMSKVFLGFVLISFSLLVGCQNTAAGFGQDMQKNGNAIEKSANS